MIPFNDIVKRRRADDNTVNNPVDVVKYVRSVDWSESALEVEPAISLMAGLVIKVFDNDNRRHCI